MEASKNDELILSVNSIMKDAPSILASNKMSVVKATEASQAILDTIEASGMSDELDEKCNSILVKLKKTKEKLNQQRSPITQLMTAVSKEFTSLEKELDPKNKDGIYYSIQQHRNKWAHHKAELQRKKEEEANRKMRLAEERINVKTQLITLVRGHFNDYLLSMKIKAQDVFESATLENFDNVYKSIKNFDENYDINQLIYMQVKAPYYLIDDTEYKEINQGVRNSLKDEFINKYSEDIRSYKSELLDKLPSKKMELETLAKADEEEKLRLEQEAVERKRIEEEKLKLEAEKSKEEAIQKADEQKEVSMANAMFDNQMQIGFEDKSHTRQGYEIVVKHALGWVAIFQFWMNKEGKDLPLDKFESKKFSTLKTYCERYAHKHDELIESKYLEYKETITVVAKAV